MRLLSWVSIHCDAFWAVHFLHLVAGLVSWLIWRICFFCFSVFSNRFGFWHITTQSIVNGKLSVVKKKIKFSVSSLYEFEMCYKCVFSTFKVALGVCFALKSWKEYLLLFTYLITLGKDVTFPLITKFKTNSLLSYLFVNRIPN